MNGIGSLNLNSNEETPYGEVINGTLIVCLNRIHRKNVIEAFQKPARYVIPGANIRGEKYTTIIMFTPSNQSGQDLQLFKNWIEGMVLTTLGPQGKAYYV